MRENIKKECYYTGCTMEREKYDKDGLPKAESLTKGLSDLLKYGAQNTPIYYQGKPYHPECLAKKLNLPMKDIKWIASKNESTARLNKKTIEIKSIFDFDFDSTTWYKGTKPTFLCVTNKNGTGEEPFYPTTWAALIRKVLKLLEGDIKNTENFEDKFNSVMIDVFQRNGFQFNNNFSLTLFEDDSFITSSLYRSNQNHKLEVCDGKYICAVYTSEVIAVINGIVKAIGGECNVIIEYIVRDNKKDEADILEMINSTKQENTYSVSDLHKEIEKCEIQERQSAKKEALLNALGLISLGIKEIKEVIEGSDINEL